MTATARFDAAFARCPLIAILRGVQPGEAIALGEALVEAGITLLEVPLNSPEPHDSIERLTGALGARAVVGAGTVLDVEEVAAVAAARGTLIVAPNTERSVIAEAVRRGLVCIPGVATPSEALVALRTGASALKLFPAEGSSPAAMKAMKAILPSETRLIPVGGITPIGMRAWREAGAAGFGIGSALYRPGMTPSEVGAAAEQFVSAL